MSLSCFGVWHSYGTAMAQLGRTHLHRSVQPVRDEIEWLNGHAVNWFREVRHCMQQALLTLYKCMTWQHACAENCNANVTTAMDTA